jgi:hypothetical protein
MTAFIPYRTYLHYFARHCMVKCHAEIFIFLLSTPHEIKQLATVSFHLLKGKMMWLPRRKGRLMRFNVLALTVKRTTFSYENYTAKASPGGLHFLKFNIEMKLKFNKKKYQTPAT